MPRPDGSLLRSSTLLVLFAFGCTTVRPAVPPSAPKPTPQVVLGDPEVELWIEGSGRTDPAESAEWLRQSRAALGEALSGRGLESSSADALLTVRERGLARTSGRKAAQVLSVVGFVVVIAVAALALVGSSKHGGSSAKAAPAHVPSGLPRGVAAPAPARPSGVAPPGRIAAPTHPGAPALALASPRPAPGGPVRPVPAPGFIGRPGAPRPAGYLRPAPDDFFGPPIWLGVQIGISSDEEGVPVASPPPEPPLEDLEQEPVEGDFVLDRGFFSGDRVELTLELRDVRTGKVLWSHVQQEAADPRDPGEIRAVVDRALAGQPWAVAGGSGEPAEHAPSDAKTH
jgi:hypothetical protein